MNENGLALITKSHQGRLTVTASILNFPLFFNFPWSLWSSWNFLGNFRKCWQVGNLPKSPWILTWHYFSTSLGQLEVPGTSRNFFGNFTKSLEFPEIPSDFEMALLFNFQNAGKLGTSQNPLRIWHYFLTSLGQVEVPGTSENFFHGIFHKPLPNLELPEIHLDFDICGYFRIVFKIWPLETFDKLNIIKIKINPVITESDRFSKH